jgi:hypothetical protein
MPLEGARFYKASPITDEEHEKAEAMWESMTGGKYSPGRKKEE